jgi:hypothetical protein
VEALASADGGCANPQAIPRAALRQLRDEEEHCQDPDLRRAIQGALARTAPPVA